MRLRRTKFIAAAAVLAAACSSPPPLPQPEHPDISCVRVPTDVALGNLQEGCSSLAGITVENECSFPIRIGAPSFVDDCGAPNCVGFVLVQSPPVPAGGLVMEPGGSVQYRVRAVSYAPEGSLQAEFSLPVSSIDDVTRETRTTTLRAAVLPRGVVRVRVDYYRHPADVLFVVDTSAFTGAFAADIRAELAQLADALRWSWRPFRLAMTTADVSEAGLQGAFIASDDNPAIIDARESGARERLLAKFDSLQWNGPDSPQPLEAMARAFTPPLSDGANAGFTDPDRGTVVFIITASDDHSPASVDEYVQTFRTGPGPKTTADAWFDSKILAAMSYYLSPRCSDEPLTGRLEEAAIATLGKRFELCDPSDDYYSAFHFYDAAFPTTQCIGPRRPDTRAPIRIWLNDVEVPELTSDGTRNWAYEPVNNCIEFDPVRFLDRHPASFEYEFEAAPECSL